MANELALTFQGDDPLYALIRRHDDAWPWNVAAAAFTLWDDQDLGDYAIGLVNRGGDFHQGDWPAGIAAGRYHVLYFRRAGAQPHADDLLIGAEEVAWDGSTVTPPPAPQPDARDLVDLTAVRLYMHIYDSAHDAALTALITQVSQQIEKLCGRAFRRQRYRLSTRCVGGTCVLLPNYPVASVERLAVGSAAAMTVACDADQLRGSVAIEGDTLRLSRTDANGAVVTESLDLLSDNPTTTQLAAAIGALTGWSAVAHVDIPADELRPTPLTTVGDRSMALMYAPTLISSFELEQEKGLIILNRPPCSDAVYVAYHAGYAIIPPDLQLLTCELVAEAYNLGRHDTSLSRETLGAYNRTMHRVGDLCAARAERLRPYLNLTLPIG